MSPCGAERIRLNGVREGILISPKAILASQSGLDRAEGAGCASAVAEVLWR